MEELSKNPKPDRWWIVALCVAIADIGLAALLWRFPTSSWAWALAGGILIFAGVFYFNPRYRYWRRANACFGTAWLLAFVPTFIAKANLEGIGVFEIVSESSPLVVLGFLVTGLFLAWLDSRQHISTVDKAGITSTNKNLHPFNSPHAVMGLTAGGNIIVNQGISEGTLVAALDARQITMCFHTGSGEPHEVDEELVWRLFDDIKAARRRFEREDATKLLADLQRRFDRSGKSWPKLLRTEALLLIAEEERARLSQSRSDGEQVDLTRLRELLKEFRDA